jgi:hypothetical protein
MSMLVSLAMKCNGGNALNSSLVAKTEPLRVDFCDASAKSSQIGNVGVGVSVGCGVAQARRNMRSPNQAEFNRPQRPVPFGSLVNRENTGPAATPAREIQSNGVDSVARKSQHYRRIGGKRMEAIFDMIVRGWDNFLARPSGSFSFRFILQPTMAGLLALRAGIQDARLGRRDYLWSILTDRQRRTQLLHEGWRGARTPFLIAIVLDVAYQLYTVRFIYPLELLFTATLLALVPYVLLRGFFNRVARLFLSAAGPTTKNRRPQSEV